MLSESHASSLAVKLGSVRHKEMLDTMLVILYNLLEATRYCKVVETDQLQIELKSMHPGMKQPTRILYEKNQKDPLWAQVERHSEKFENY